MAEEIQSRLREGFDRDDVSAVASIFRAQPELLNPAGCARPPVTLARSVPTAERLLSLGASLHAVGDWWASGFGTGKVDPSVADFLVERGARLTPHAAAGLGLAEPLAEMLNAHPSLIDAKGGDGCTPLHFARDTKIAQLLLDRGARVDALDDDHRSTPAQWLIGDSPDVSRCLLNHGARPDIFLASALGDLALVQKLVSANPLCTGFRIGKAPEFPSLGHQGRGGTIYQWTLAFNSYPHQVALLKGHQAVFEYLLQHSDIVTRFLVFCLLARRDDAQRIASQNPALVASLPAVDLELLARYCWETNLNYNAVKLMLDLGFPVAHPETAHGYTPLHNAAWAGDAPLVELLLARGHPVDILDPVYKATPLGFALHNCLIEKRHPEGAFPRVVQSLLNAGSPWNPLSYPTGHAGLDEVFKSRLPS